MRWGALDTFHIRINVLSIRTLWQTYIILSHQWLCTPIINWIAQSVIIVCEETLLLTTLIATILLLEIEEDGWTWTLDAFYVIQHIRIFTPYAGQCSCTVHATRLTTFTDKRLWVFEGTQRTFLRTCSCLFIQVCMETLQTIVFIYAMGTLWPTFLTIACSIVIIVWLLATSHTLPILQQCAIAWGAVGPYPWATQTITRTIVTWTLKTIHWGWTLT